MNTEKSDAILTALESVGREFAGDCSGYAMDRARELAYRILSADYWRDVNAVAQDVRDQVKAGEITGRDSADQYIHESVDGSSRAIYTAQAIECLLISNNDGEVVDVTGEFPMSGDSPNWSAAAYWAFMRDIMDELGDLDDLFDEDDNEDEDDDEADQ